MTRTNIHPAKITEYRQALAEIRAALGSDADDQTVQDTAEGETDILDVVGALLQAREEAIAHQRSMMELSTRYIDKAHVWHQRAERIKRALGRLRDIMGQNIKHPAGTVIISERKPDVERAIDFDVNALPDDLVRLKREPDMAKIKEAVKAGRNVPGVRLGEPKRVVTIK